MLNRLLSTIISIAACIVVNAQGTCIISGNIADSKLSNGKNIKKVYLTRANEYGQETLVAEAKVKKGKYTIKHELAKEEPVLQYTITGFGEGEGIKLFVESGEVTINTPSAAQASKSSVTGTETNDLYNEYKRLICKAHCATSRQIATLEEQHGKEWLASTEGKNNIKRIEAKEAINTESQILRFLIEHNASPLTPLEVEHTMLPKLTPAYAEQITKAISTTLHNHPYYHSLRNKMLSNSMNVGRETPNITLPLNGDKTAHIADYRGKYILLNFWAKDCAKSAEMIAELKKLCEVIKKEPEKFIIISYSLDSDKAAWREAINSNNMNCDGWLHACDGMGKNSPAAKLYKAEETPKIILIEPEGRAVSLNMEIEEIVMRAEQVLAGELYYLDNQEE